MRKALLQLRRSPNAFARKGWRFSATALCLSPAAALNLASVIMAPGAVPGKSTQRSLRASLKFNERW